MKRITGLLVLALFLAVPTLALAAEQMGVYVAPKLIYGYTLMEGMRGEVDGGIGTVIRGKTSDHTLGGALAVGYDFNKKTRLPLRAELEYAAFSDVTGKKAKHNNLLGAMFDLKQKLRIQSLFVNAYYDFHNKTSFTPYLGAGLGVAFISDRGSWHDSFGYSPRLGSKSTTNFAWNIGAGAAYDITNWCSIDLGYRFAGLGDAKTKWGYDGGAGFRAKTKNIYMHQVMTSVRFTF